jgi:hypothetical protein
MSPATPLTGLVPDGVLDAGLGAVLWLLAEGGLPLVVAGKVEAPTRAAVAGSILAVEPDRPWVLLDAITG